MNTIELVVGGRAYAISCEEGEEAHVQRLGEAIDAKFQAMGPRYSQNLLFASLQLADELHEARKATEAALADKRKVQEGFDAFREKSAEERREADTAVGQRDELRGKIATLEQELDRLQSAQQSATEETAGIRTELAALREKEGEWEAQENRLHAEMADLREQLSAAREAAAAAQPSSFAGANTTGGDLPIALEQFAQLLEETADKLESKAGSS